MANQRQNLDQLLGQAERIGVVGSPSSTSEMALDILATAVTKKLVGELALFRYLQDGLSHYALGQITEVKLRNVWHEDPTMRSLIRQRGRVDAISERQDTHLGEMTISAVFSAGADGYRPSILGTVPATGTPIHLADDAVLGELLQPYRDQLFYLGQVYGSRPLLPVWFKHFDSGPQGAGEAYHLGIFGKTGSGKSVLAKMILLAYARHPQMGLFILDPAGEFASGLRNDSQEILMGNILCQPILRGLGRPVEVYDLSRLRLGRWEIFGELLIEYGFLENLGVKSSSYQQELAEYIVPSLREKFTLKELISDEAYMSALDTIASNIHRVYAEKPGQTRVQAFVNEAKSKVNQPNFTIRRRWNSVAELFATGPGKQEAEHVVRQALRSSGTRPLVVVDLSRRPVDIAPAIWDEKIKPLLIDHFLDELIRQGEGAYQKGVLLNTLVVLDEAHRLAPQGQIENERRRRIRQTLIDAARTTRKYGLGWMFISLTLASLHSEIVQQLRTHFFGFGLNSGSERESLREIAGREGIRLYERFRDPQSAFDAESREYSFMTLGPVSPLSFGGTPLFFNAFTAAKPFLDANGFPKPLV